MQDSKRMDSFKGITFKKDYKDFISKIHSARKNNVLSTDLVTTDYVEIGFDDIDDTIGAGKYHMFYDGVEFRFFINPVRSEHLYVFLNGRDPRKDYYSRWSWNARGFTLAIMDPMVLMNDLKIGWYYGTKETDYREKTADIIMKIADVFGFQYDKVILYGSSGGGTASFFISTYLPGSTSVSINPQFNLKSMPTFSKKLESVIGPLDSPELAPRNNFSKTLSKSKSRHLFLVNCLSYSDFYFLTKYMSSAKIPVKYGLSEKGNVKVWTFEGKSLLSTHGDWTYHTSNDYLEMFPFICTVVEDWDNPNWTNMALMLNELWFKQLSANHDIIALKTFIEPDKDSWSIFRLAVMYEKGDYVGKDVEMAFALLKDSVELGNKEALKYLTGKFKEKNGPFSARVDEYVASRKK